MPVSADIDPYYSTTIEVDDSGFYLQVTVETDDDWVTWTFDFPVEEFTGDGNLNVGLIIALDGEGEGPAFQIHNNDGATAVYPHGTWMYGSWGPAIDTPGTWFGWPSADLGVPVTTLDWVEASGARKGQGTDGILQIKIDRATLGDEFHWAASPTVGSGFYAPAYDVTMQIPTAFGWSTPIVDMEVPNYKVYPRPVENLNTGSTYWTIQAAIDAADTDDILLVNPGTYEEGLLEIYVEGLTLEAKGEAEDTVIQGPLTGGGLVQITANDVTLDGFTIEGTDSGGTTGCVWIYGPSEAVTGVTIENNIIVYTGADPVNSWGGVISSGTTGVTVNNNRISNFRLGVYLNPTAEPWIISNNIIEDSVHCGIGIDSSGGVEVTGNTIIDGYLGLEIFRANVLVEDNDFQNNDVQVLDFSEVQDIEQLLDDNTFDRAVVIDRLGESLLPVIYSYIQDAIDEAESEDTVLVHPGTYIQTGNLVIDEEVSILGVSETKPTIQFDEEFSVAIEANNVLLEHLSFYKTNKEET